MAARQQRRHWTKMINNEWQALGVGLLDMQEITRIVTSNTARIDLTMWLWSEPYCTSVLFFFIYINWCAAASKTRNTYVSGTVTECIEIPTANLGFLAMTSSKKVCPSQKPKFAIKILTIYFQRYTSTLGSHIAISARWSSSIFLALQLEKYNYHFPSTKHRIEAQYERWTNQ